MYYKELQLMGWTDQRLADEASKMFGRQITLDGSDDSLTRSRRALWFRELTQRTMGPKTAEVRGFVGATDRGPAPAQKEPAPYPPPNDLLGAIKWIDTAMDDGTYDSDRDLVALHELNDDHWEAFEQAFTQLVEQRRRDGKSVPS